MVWAAAVAACGGFAPPAAPVVRRAAATALGSLTSVRMDIGFGPGLPIDELTLFAGSAAVEPPARSDASFRVRRGGLLVDLRVIGVGGRRYVSVPPAPFQELSAFDGAEIPDPAALLGHEGGLPRLLLSGARPAYRGTATIAGAAVDEVGATWSAAQLQPLIRAQPAGDGTATIWAGRSDHLVRRVLLTGPLREAGERFTVDLRLHDFDRPLSIAAPDQGG